MLNVVASIDFKRRVVVVDDESIIRFLLTSLLEQNGFECWSAQNAVDAMALIRRIEPDVVIVDLDLGVGASGAELITVIRSQHDGIGIVLLSNFIPKKTEQLALDRVVYLHKSQAENASVLRDAIDRSTRSVMSETSNKGPANRSQVQALTANQQEVLGLLSEGKSNQEIAQRMVKQVRSIERTVSRIYIKLGLTEKHVGARRVEAARIYLQDVGSSRARS